MKHMGFLCLGPLCGCPVVLACLSVYLISRSEYICALFGPIWLRLHLQSVYWLHVVKGCAWTLNHVSYRLKSIEELSEKNPCPDHIFSSLGPIWLILYTHSAWNKRVFSDLEWCLKVKCHQTMHLQFFQTILSTYFPLISIWLMIHINRAFWKRVCSDL